jgi:hypothetical protein
VKIFAQMIDDVVAKSGVTVAEDFDIPQVSDQQIQDAMKKQQQMMGPQTGDDQDGPNGQAPGKPADTKKGAGKKTK